MLNDKWSAPRFAARSKRDIGANRTYSQRCCGIDTKFTPAPTTYQLAKATPQNGFLHDQAAPLRTLRDGVAEARLVAASRACRSRLRLDTWPQLPQHQTPQLSHTKNPTWVPVRSSRFMDKGYNRGPIENEANISRFHPTSIQPTAIAGGGDEPPSVRRVLR
jgi:hypothetical protein